MISNRFTRGAARLMFAYLFLMVALSAPWQSRSVDRSQSLSQATREVLMDNGEIIIVYSLASVIEANEEPLPDR